MAGFAFRNNEHRGFSSPYAILAIVALVTMYSYIDRSLISILQVPLKQDLALSDAQLGALTGISFALVYSTVGIPLSSVADRVSRTILMAVALAVWSLMTALSGLATTYWALIVLRMGVALGESACMPAGISLNSDLFPRDRRGLPLAMMAAAVPLGTTIGLAGAGWLSEPLGWRGTFVSIGLSGLLLVPFLLLAREPKRGQFDHAHSEPRALPFKHAVATVWRSRGLRYLVAGNGMQMFTHTAVTIWAAPFYSRQFDLSLAEIGMVLGVLFGLLGGIGTLVGGYLSDRLSRRGGEWYGWFPAICAALALPAALGQLISPSATASIAFGAVAAFFLNMYIAPIMAGGQALATPNTRALTAAVLAFAGSAFGNGLGPFFVGAASDYLVSVGFGPASLQLALIASLFGSLAAIILFFFGARHMRTASRQFAS